MRWLVERSVRRASRGRFAITTTRAVEGGDSETKEGRLDRPAWIARPLPRARADMTARRFAGRHSHPNASSP